MIKRDVYNVVKFARPALYKFQKVRERAHLNYIILNVNVFSEQAEKNAVSKEVMMYSAIIKILTALLTALLLLGLYNVSTWHSLVLGIAP